MQSYRSWRAVRIIAFTVAALALATNVAVADNIDAEAGDTATAITGSQLSFGTVCVGASKDATIALAAVRSGNYPGPQVYENGATVTFTRTALSGSGLSGSANPLGNVTLPGDWSSAGNNAVSGSVSTTLTYAPTAPGSLSGSVSFTGTGDGSQGGTSTVTRAVSLTISGSAVACDTTPPVITPSVSGTEGDNGWYVSNVTVSWSVHDAESAITSSSGCGATTLSTDTTGVTYTCSATSAGGTSSGSVTVKRDETVPYDVTVSADRAPDSTGWYTAPFVAAWSGSDATSGIASCTQTAYSGPDTGNGSLSGTCSDGAGNTGSVVAFPFKYDATGPTVIGTPDRAPDHNGWYNAPVTVTWSVLGDTSGEGVCDAPTVYSGPDDDAVILSGSCTDGAGNAGAGTFGALSYDATAPVVSIVADRAPNSIGWYRAPLTATTDGTDAVSGIGSCTAPQVYAGPDTAAGSLGGTCTDVAGNTSAPVSLSFAYDASAPDASIAADRSPDSNGWYNASITATTTGTDNLSGIASCTSPQAYGGPDGQNLSLEGTCTDGAGNTSLPASLLFNYDATAPSIVFASRLPAANDDGWNDSAVTVTWDCDDDLSGALVPSVSVVVSTDGADQVATGVCEDAAGNPATNDVGGINIDQTAPTIGFLSRTAPNANGWNNGPVTAWWTCGDALSGPAAALVSDTVTTEGTDQTATGTCSDLAGNTASASVSGIDIDLTDPYDITWIGGPDAGESYPFGSVPAAPTCSASDDLSGFDDCIVAGYSDAVGSHTMTATAFDRAGNAASETRSYTVLAWTLRGFFSPVDMNGVWNTVRGGSTVPLKWEMFAGTTELTDIATVDHITATPVACAGGTADAIEVSATGGSSLRYDWTAGQFVFNWQTPRTPGACYRLSMKADDGSTLSALFKLK